MRRAGERSEPDRVPGGLAAAEVARSMRLSMIDGALFAAMIGAAETSFLAEAVRLGAGALAIGLVTSLPLLCGGLGSVLILRGLERVPRRRTWVVACAVGQIAVLLALALVAAFDVDRTALLLALLCGYHTCGQAAGTAWSSWYGDLVPKDQRGRWFAARTRIVHVATFASVLVGGAVLHWLPPPGGFAVLFGFAALARIASALLLLRSGEPPYAGQTRAPGRVPRDVGRRARGVRTLLVGIGAFQVGVYLAAPFFGPYILTECGLPYSGYMVTLGAVVAAKAVCLPLWGRLVDRLGSRRSFALALLLSAFIPLPFLWAHGLLGLALAYAWSGLAWAGYEVAAFALLLDSSTKASRPRLFAAQGLVNGGAQLGGSMAGAGLMAAGGYGVVFGVSFAARMCVALGLPWFMGALARRRRGQRRRDLVLRLSGIRPHGGMVHRPVLLTAAADESAAGAPMASAGATANAPSAAGAAAALLPLAPGAGPSQAVADRAPSTAEG